MKKPMVFFAVIVFIVILSMPGLGADAPDRVKQPVQQVKPTASQIETYTVICPATIKAYVGTDPVSPGGAWKAYPHKLLRELAFDFCEVTQQYLKCAYVFPPFCQLKELGNMVCWTSLLQEIRPGYSCEKLPTNNGFTCRLKKPKTEEQYKHDKQPKN